MYFILPQATAAQPVCHQGNSIFGSSACGDRLFENGQLVPAAERSQ
jgi:hypothetical protein